MHLTIKKIKKKTPCSSTSDSTLIICNLYMYKSNQEVNGLLPQVEFFHLEKAVRGKKEKTFLAYREKARASGSLQVRG